MKKKKYNLRRPSDEIENYTNKIIESIDINHEILPNMQALENAKSFLGNKFAQSLCSWFVLLFFVCVLGIFMSVSISYGNELNTKNAYIVSKYDRLKVEFTAQTTVNELFAQNDILITSNDKIYKSMSDIVEENEEIRVEFGYNEELASPVSSVVNAVLDYTQLGTVVQSSSGYKTYSAQYSVLATGYCSCSICCGPYDGTSTANGSTPTVGHTIATPSTYDFGTMVYIPDFDDGYDDGIFEVQDRGGAIQGNRIDIYFGSHQEALNFGVRTVTMYVLN